MVPPHNKHQNNNSCNPITIATTICHPIIISTEFWHPKKITINTVPSNYPDNTPPYSNHNDNRLIPQLHNNLCNSITITMTTCYPYRRKPTSHNSHNEARPSQSDQRDNVPSQNNHHKARTSQSDCWDNIPFRNNLHNVSLCPKITTAFTDKQHDSVPPHNIQ